MYIFNIGASHTCRPRCSTPITCHVAAAAVIIINNYKGYILYHVIFTTETSMHACLTYSYIAWSDIRELFSRHETDERIVHLLNNVIRACHVILYHDYTNK